MARASSQRVLLIGDTDRHIQSAVARALPGAQIRSTTSIFDGIAELAESGRAAANDPNSGPEPPNPWAAAPKRLCGRCAN
jgi:hypothetical protein